MRQLAKFCVPAAIAGIFVVLTPIDAAVAQSATKLVKQRISIMKEFRSHTKAIGKFVKGPPKGLTGKKLARANKRLGTAIDVELRAEAIAGQSARLMKYFPKGTSMTDSVGANRSKPVIWTEWSDFEAAAAKLGKLANDLQVAAASGDKGQIGAALKTMGKQGCGGCHKTFRGPKPK